ncbi:uncharacterized protein LOC143377076 [Andrena cerasifolii]|uniref:uncharacterized protein LOC143377076 n=1 Tax=Andrena cerasifolii TaxID=2819439 RepID=UPI0040379D8F
MASTNRDGDKEISQTSPPKWQLLVKEIRLLLQGSVRLLANFKKMGKAKFTEENAEDRLVKLNETWNRCEALNLELELLLPDAERSACPFVAQEEFARAEDEYWAARDFLREIIKSFQSPQTSGSSDGTQEGFSRGLARLPTIALPKFSGEYTEWPSFRDLFTSLVIGNATLSDTTRLQYLQSAVEGQAAETIAHITITEANFGPAWALLTQEFENKRAIVSAHLRDLLTLPPMAGVSATELRRLRAPINRALSLLANLGRPTEHWDDIIVALTTMKLDPELMEEWELSLGVSTDPPSYATLDQFMKTRIRSLEASRPAQEAAAPERTKDAKSSSGSTRAVPVYGI